MRVCKEEWPSASLAGKKVEGDMLNKLLMLMSFPVQYVMTRRILLCIHMTKNTNANKGAKAIWVCKLYSNVQYLPYGHKTNILASAFC